MMGISISIILTNVQKISRNPDITFPGNGKFQNPRIFGKFSVPTSREETLVPVDRWPATPKRAHAALRRFLVIRG